MIKKILLGLTIAAIAGVAIAQQPGIKRTPLQKLDFPAGYNMEGELDLVIDGKPPMKIKAGESYQIPEGAIHDAKAGDKPFKVLAIYIVKAGEPLAKPAP